ncbi:uncharacterized protein BROUX77_000520 [Berkeleyomyces rouxiae]|uniref:uncharacterized protein n=1 Tax=Berkeleyomyces rouxiae TaxID=2035830 RepID=UPI003B7C9CD2
MLLPSAFACDAASQRLQSALASPPMSPLSLMPSTPAVSNIIAACRSLHAILASAPTPMSEHKSTPDSKPTRSLAPSPTLAHVPAPLKLQLQQPSCEALRNPTPPPTASVSTFPISITSTPKRKRSTEHGLAESPIPPMAPRASVKRRRVDTDLDAPSFSLSAVEPRTPKRMRICPEVMPLGLMRADFYDAWRHENPQASPCSASPASVASSAPSSLFDSDADSDADNWTDEDDSILIDTVLNKLRLSRQEWQECARSLGRNRNTIGRRWKSLLMGGEVGLKRARSASC